MTDTDTIVTFNLDRQFLGIRVSEVHEVLLAQTLTPVPRAHPVVAGLINMRGQIVSVVDVRRMLRLPPRPQEFPAPVNVIVRSGRELISLLVDSVGGVLDLESRLLTAPPDTTSPETRNLFRGAYQLPGQLLLIFDTERAIAALVSQTGSKASRDTK
jgi:purine-binding chemotaxis protein CheW